MSTFFSLGFRPFFLTAALWAALAMALWLGALAGLPVLPHWVDPFAWHSHELVFGYVSAALAGFLLTAAPSWTKTKPVTGAPLAGLLVLWLAARNGALMTGLWPIALVLLLDLALPLALIAIVARQIWMSRNWRNLSVLGTMVLLATGMCVFAFDPAMGQRLGLAAGLVMVALVGGRVVPNFTRNWLRGQNRGPVPMEPDLVTYLMNGGLLAVLLLWVFVPSGLFTSVALIAAGLAHGWRLSRWGGWHTGEEPLVWVLHLAYAFLPIGALVMGAAILTDTPGAAALHLWTVGAIGLMTAAVMTRATLGHSGGVLTANRGTTAAYLAIAAAALLRPLGGHLSVPLLQNAAGVLWIIAFLGLVLLYGPRQIGWMPRPKPELSET